MPDKFINECPVVAVDQKDVALKALLVSLRDDVADDDDDAAAAAVVVVVDEQGPS